ncbi:MAG: diphthine--ammonia ligase [Clostridium perfringens]|nr:diphthine--ammonia ligase [Clostridium perfringens]
MEDKYIVSYSTGKDSVLALCRAIKSGKDVVGLLVITHDDKDTSWFHETPLRLIKSVSKSLDISLILVKASGENYEKDFEEGLKRGQELGATCCIFGDIDIDSHRKWCDDRCKKVSMKSDFPLWQESREDLVFEFVEADFKAVIKKVNLNYLDENFLGLDLDKETLKRIKEKNCDVCGENGEYHTFVYDGPLFKGKVDFKVDSISKDETFAHLNIF